MEYKYKYNTDAEIDILISEHNDKFFIGLEVGLDDKFAVFSDEKLIHKPTTEEIVKEQGDKISILEEENEALKVELSITQDAVNELLFNTLNA